MAYWDDRNRRYDAENQGDLHRFDAIGWDLVYYG